MGPFGQERRSARSVRLLSVTFGRWWATVATTAGESSNGQRAQTAARSSTSASTGLGSTSDVHPWCTVGLVFRNCTRNRVIPDGRDGIDLCPTGWCRKRSHAAQCERVSRMAESQQSHIPYSTARQSRRQDQTWDTFQVGLDTPEVYIPGPVLETPFRPDSGCQIPAPVRPFRSA
jgi:hypothetical protein